MKKIFYILLSLVLIASLSLFIIINFIAEQSVAHIIDKVNEEVNATLTYDNIDCNVFSGSINITDIDINYNNADWSVKEAAIKDFDYFNQPPHKVNVTVHDLKVPMEIIPAKGKIILLAHGIDPLNFSLNVNNHYNPDTLDYDLTFKLTIDKMMSYDVTLSLGNLTEKSYKDLIDSITNEESPLVIISKIANAKLKTIQLQFTNQDGLEVISKMNGLEISTAEKRSQLAQRVEQMMAQIEQGTNIDLNNSRYSDFNRVVSDLKQVIHKENKFTLSFSPETKTITELMTTVVSLKQLSNSQAISKMNQLCKFISLTY